VSGHDDLHRAGPSGQRPPEPFTDRLRLAVAAYLARFKGSSREHTESAAGKPEPLPAGQDAADAAAAGPALAAMLDGSAPLASSVRCAPQEPFNLLAAMALRAGLRIDPAGLHAEVLVVAARPGLRAPR
jgi:hypothetical protein